MELIATDNRQVVVGLGATGLSCARYLASKQRKFSVVDSRQNPPGLDEFNREFASVPLTLGEISSESLAGAGRLVVSPGVSLKEPAIAQAMAEGVAVCGDIDLFREDATAPIVAITGSNGKSTVTALVAEMAKQAGKKIAVGGNFGTPALALLSEQEPDLYVLELSSFQLERCVNLAAEVSTVLNISADHMDRYDSMLAYHQAKHRIFRNCKKIVINRADTLSRPLMAEGVEVLTFGLDNADFNGFGLMQEQGEEWLSFQFKPLMPVSELKMIGRHNIENALAALALGKSADLEMAPMLQALRNFSGLEHRCQWVAAIDGVDFYNDSKGTNVGASIAAIKGLETRANNIVLLAGGVAKGANFTPLLPVLMQYVSALIIFGEAADELESLCGEDIHCIRVDSMEQAVNSAAEVAESGDAILLSPACASFDMFDNYQHRGEVFTQAVLVLADGGNQ